MLPLLALFIHRAMIYNILDGWVGVGSHLSSIVTSLVDVADGISSTLPLRDAAVLFAIIWVCWKLLEHYRSMHLPKEKHGTLAVWWAWQLELRWA
jgi:hypothetical protein